MTNRAHHLAEAADHLDIALIALRGVTGLNHTGPEINQAQLDQARESLDDAKTHLTEGGQAALAAKLPTELFSVRSGIMVKGTRMAEKHRAGRLAVQVRGVRDEIEALDEGIAPAPPCVWHDAEAQARVVAHPAFWVLVVVTQGLVLWSVLGR